MKTTQLLMFTVPIGVMAAGFTIGGRDGAIFSMVGAAGLLIVSFWQAIKLVNQDDKKPKFPPLRGHRDWVWRLGLAPDAPLVASASQDGTVRVWNFENGEPSCDFPLDAKRGGMGVVFGPGNTLLVTDDLMGDNRVAIDTIALKR